MALLSLANDVDSENTDLFQTEAYSQHYVEYAFDVHFLKPHL